MRWLDLAFLHWPIAPEVLRPLIPSSLHLDTFENHAWVGVVPFRMTRVRPRLVPPFPWLFAFPELNVRTYVTADGKPGVWFFSLDAGSPLAVRLARWTFSLPYHDSHISASWTDDRMTYESVRTHPRAPQARFRARYWPVGDVYRSDPDTLERWLTARYCLYTVDGKGILYRGEIHHDPWPLQVARVECELNTMVSAAGIKLPPTPPVAHFARQLDVVAWMLRPVLAGSTSPRLEQ